MDNGLIIILIGTILTITIYGSLIGIPLIFIGIIIAHKDFNKIENGISETIAEKQEELNNIEETLAQKEQEHQEKLDKLEEERIAQVDEELKNRDTELDQLIAQKEEQLQNIDEEYKQKQKTKEETLKSNLQDLNTNVDSARREYNELRKEIMLFKDEVEMQEYGLYEPKYNFINATDYKERLDSVRKQQKQMIKDKTAALGATEWTIDGSKSKGKAFINANIKQILRSFNNETEVIISKVKHSNLESSKNRIQKSFDVLNKLYTREKVHLTQGYLNLKMDEMYLAYEYEVKKQEEKEELREAREREREEKKLKKELEKEKKKFERQNETINSEIEEVRAQMAQAAADEKAKLEAEIAKLQEALNRNNEEVKKINEWKEKPGAGYVYIISNIGSFGKDVFKIGVTRRDNPEERIRELSNASVPFRFDAHVFIFSKDAYELESQLHERFDDRRVNKMNMRKEFFRITIDDVKQIVEENKGQVHSFVEHPDAEEYYDTLKKEKRFNAQEVLI